MTTEQLNLEAARWTKDYLAKESLGSAEELQMLSAAYAQLFLSACENKSRADLGTAHGAIADCFKKLGDNTWETKHRTLAAAYAKTD